MTKSKVFEIAMADIEKAPTKQVWSEDVWKVVEAGKDRGLTTGKIVAVLNKGFFVDNPIRDSQLDARWRRRP